MTNGLQPAGGGSMISAFRGTAAEPIFERIGLAVVGRPWVRDRSHGDHALNARAEFPALRR